MPGIYSMMDISRWALNSFTDQLNVISHNVANVNTEGYSRQSAVLATRTPELTSSGAYGHGVKTTTVIQYADSLLSERLTSKNSDLLYYDARTSQLKRLEALANEAGETGLGNELTNFFNSWQDLSNNPTSSAVRNSLLETSNNLVERFSSITSDMMSVQRDIDGYIKDAVAQANTICRSIAELNNKIQQMEITGHTANDYRDERQRQLSALSGLMNISWYEDAKGAVSVQTTSGKTLVQNNYPSSSDADPLNFEDKTDEGYDWNQLTWSDSGLTMDYTEITGGQIGAWLQVRDVDIKEMLDYMNELASEVIYATNSVHSSGAGLDMFNSVTGTYTAKDSSAALNATVNGEENLSYGDKVVSGSFDVWVYQAGTRTKTTINIAPTDSMDDVATAINSVTGLSASVTSLGALSIHADEGVEFAFANDSSNALAALGINTYFSGDTATSIAVNRVVTNDVNKICAGVLAEDGSHSEGSNECALDIADLKDADTMSDETETFNESLISWAASLGTVISHSEDNYSFAEETMTQLYNLRDSVSGVNTDEEMVKMIQYQRAYQMAAQMIKVSDELLQTLIQIGG